MILPPISRSTACTTTLSGSARPDSTARCAPRLSLSKAPDGDEGALTPDGAPDGPEAALGLDGGEARDTGDGELVFEGPDDELEPDEATAWLIVAIIGAT
jgi:hypothetical protein